MRHGNANCGKDGDPGAGATKNSRTTNNSQVAAIDTESATSVASTGKSKKKVTIAAVSPSNGSKKLNVDPGVLGTTRAAPAPLMGTGRAEAPSTLEELPKLQSVSAASFDKNGRESETPSLASLIRGSSSGSYGSTSEQEGDRYSSSTVEAPKAQELFPRVFEGIPQADDIDLCVETLAFLVAKWHVLYDPATDIDPIHEFGVVDGLLPECAIEDSVNLRNLVIRWSLPHCMCLWENLPSTVEEFRERTFSMHDLIATDFVNTTFYSLHPQRLDTLGQMILALTQVIQGLADFMHQRSAAIFCIDPNFSMLRLLAWHDNPTYMVLTVQILQERSVLAVKHAKRWFNYIRRSCVTTHTEVQSISSYNSSTDSERLRYASHSPLSSIVNFAQRRDSRIAWDDKGYAAMEELLQRRKLAGKPELVTSPYLRRAEVTRIAAPDEVVQARKAYLDSVPDIPRSLGLASSHSISGHFASLRTRTDSPTPRSEFPPLPKVGDLTALKPAPASISSFLKNHSVSVLPGMGKFPTLPQESRRDAPPHMPASFSGVRDSRIDPPWAHLPTLDAPQSSLLLATAAAAAAKADPPGNLRVRTK